MLSTILFAVLFSLDTFFAGIACGLRQVKFPVAAGACIGIFSASFLVAGGFTGSGLSSIVPVWLSRWLGAGILGGLGIWLLWSSYRSDPATDYTTGDRDASGDLSIRELLWLGIALGTDGFTGAAGLALTGASPLDIILLATLVAATSGAAFHLGHRLAGHLSMEGNRWTRSASGWVLLLLGVIRLGG